MLTINNITVDFGGVKAVDNVSFSFQDRELLGLIGPNGAGKTTLMKVITGTVKPTSGSVSLDKSNLNGKAPYLRIRAGIGISQQIVHPFNSMTVLENVTFAAGHSKTDQVFLSLFKTNRAIEKEEALNLLKMVEIEDVADEKPENLPLGYIKRLELARALALKPKLLLLDEPLAGLNQSEAERLSNTLLKLNQQGQNIILIEHNLTEVVRICQRLVVIDNGKKIGEGEPKTVMNNPVVRTAYLGRS
jgi:branched-chain amino acid transport system ATP-binding protein